jgi:hypothetical protein
MNREPPPRPRLADVDVLAGCGQDRGAQRRPQDEAARDFRLTHDTLTHDNTPAGAGPRSNGFGETSRQRVVAAAARSNFRSDCQASASGNRPA